MIFFLARFYTCPDIGMEWRSGIEVGSCRILRSNDFVLFSLCLARSDCILL